MSADEQTLEYMLCGLANSGWTIQAKTEKAGEGSAKCTVVVDHSTYGTRLTGVFYYGDPDIALCEALRDVYDRVVLLAQYSLRPKAGV